MKNKIFYGWYIVAVGTVMAGLNSAIFGYGWTAFVNPILATFGWSMTQLSLASSLRSLEQGVFNPVWGIAVDRWSPRKLMVFGVIVTALGIFCLSQTRNLYMYYGGFVIVGMGSSLVSGMLPQVVITRWFRKGLGKATGLFTIGMGIGGVIVPLVAKVVDAISWQNVLLIFAAVFLVIGIPATFLMRSRPEDYGTLPDGKVQDDRPEVKRKPRYDSGIGIGEALRTRAFWHLAVVFLFQNAAVATIQFYAMPYLTSMGMSRAMSSSVVMLYMLVSLPLRMPLGMFSDRLKKTQVMTFAIVMQASGMFVFWLLNGNSPFWLVLLFATTYGIGLAGMNPLRAPILVEYFGVKNFGGILGITSIFSTIANMGSQPLVGWIYDNYHDYRICWLGIVGMGMLALVAMLTIPVPNKGK